MARRMLATSMPVWRGISCSPFRGQADSLGARTKEPSASPSPRLEIQACEDEADQEAIEHCLRVEIVSPPVVGPPLAPAGAPSSLGGRSSGAPSHAPSPRLVMGPTIVPTQREINKYSGLYEGLKPLGVESESPAHEPHDSKILVSEPDPSAGSFREVACD